MTRRPSRLRVVALCSIIALALPVAGCGTDAPASPEARPSRSGAAEASSTPTPEASGSATVSEPDPTYSLPAIAAKAPDAGDLVVLRDAGSTTRYTREAVSYRSDGLTITGVLLRPRGTGPFPAVVIVHGRVPIKSYRTGGGLEREQDALVAAGYVVFQSDLRGHAGSDPLGPFDQQTMVGYSRDVINALATLRTQEYVDRDRVGVLGRSMGGGITMNVLTTHPELARAAVLLSPISSSFAQARALLASLGRPADRDSIPVEFGTQEANPAFYRNLSPRTYFSKITASVLIQHGTADPVCPLVWSQTTLGALRTAGVDADLELYEGERHIFDARQAQAIQNAVTYFDRQLG
ncbi:alpha/beta fold hydrolase [Nocardioides sp. WS12]|uniref:alpha/beta hydrolase family protein n=1 Tax=Nocardioides sp. WS12 TaxID=2486272 RepID=UPI0015FBBCDB|nr:alpha/beta fold hydrolase [Nocardioides sp. WS12]